MIPHIRIKYEGFLYLCIRILADLPSPLGVTFTIRMFQVHTVCSSYQMPPRDEEHELCPVINGLCPQTHQLSCNLTYISYSLCCSNLHGSSQNIRKLDTADQPLSASGYYYNSSLTNTDGGTDWMQQRHAFTPFVLHRILLKWTLNNKNSDTDWIQLATLFLHRDIITTVPLPTPTAARIGYSSGTLSLLLYYTGYY